jgi:hypothetical protein
MTALIVSGAVGVCGIGAPVVLSISERHTAERRRVIEKREDAYVSLIASFDPVDAYPRDALIDTKISVYATREMRDLYYVWLHAMEPGHAAYDPNPEHRTRRENDIRDRARFELQETKLNEIPIRT